MKFKDERGAVMLESTYCILLAIFVLFFFLSYGFFLYQKTSVGIVANEVAEEIATTYKLRTVADSENVTAAQVGAVGKYRYFLFSKKFDTSNESKGKTLADARLTQTDLSKDKGGLKVSVETVKDGIGRRHYEVTVKNKYQFLLGEFLTVIGQKDTQTIETTVYVESYDVLSYANTIKFTQYGIKKLADNSTILGTINSAISLLSTLFSSS